MQSAGARTERTAEGSEWVQRAVERISSLSDIYSKGWKKRGGEKKERTKTTPSKAVWREPGGRRRLKQDRRPCKKTLPWRKRQSHSAPLTVRRGSLQKGEERGG